MSPYDYPGVAEVLNMGELVVPPGAPKGEEKERAISGDKNVGEETGIATQLALDRYVAAAKQVEQDWTSLDPDGRANRLGDAANAELAAIGVPEVGVRLKYLGAPEGRFDNLPWNIDLNATRFDPSTTTTGRMATVASTVYHESRHAEQWFRMARLEAGQGKNAAAIASELDIAPRVAAAAEKSPLTGDSQQAKEAATWHKSVYGPGAGDARNETIKRMHAQAKEMDTALAASEAAEAASDAVRNNATATPDDKRAALNAWKAAFNAYKAVKAAFEASWAEYRALPEEVDAWRLGDRVGAEYRK